MQFTKKLWSTRIIFSSTYCDIDLEKYFRGNGTYCKNKSVVETRFILLLLTTYEQIFESNQFARKKLHNTLPFLFVFFFLWLESYRCKLMMNKNFFYEFSLILKLINLFKLVYFVLLICIKIYDTQQIIIKITYDFLFFGFILFMNRSENFYFFETRKLNAKFWETKKKSIIWWRKTKKWNEKWKKTTERDKKKFLGWKNNIQLSTSDWIDRLKDSNLDAYSDHIPYCHHNHAVDHNHQNLMNNPLNLVSALVTSLALLYHSVDHPLSTVTHQLLF